MSWKRFFFAFFLLSAILAGDALLKVYVRTHISPIHLVSSIYPYGGIAVIEAWHGIDFSIVHAANSGAAWGLFASFKEYLLYARVLIIGALLSYLLFVKTGRFRQICLLFITAGAIGNVLDMFIYGYVIDMFYANLWGYSFPIFNLADTFICFGVCLLLLESYLLKLKRVKKSADKAV
jgi:signal peptidase II